jgi:hypothetical protein
MLDRKVVKGIRNVTYILSTFYTITLLITLSDTYLGKTAMTMTGVVFQTLEVFLFYMFMTGKAFAYKVPESIKNLSGVLFLTLFFLSITASLSYNMNETNNTKNNSIKNSRSYQSKIKAINEKNETIRVYKKHNRVTDANNLQNEVLKLEKELLNTDNTEHETKGYTALFKMITGKNDVSVLEFIILAIISVTLEVICILCCYLVEFKLEKTTVVKTATVEKEDSKAILSNSKNLSLKTPVKSVKQPEKKIEPVIAKRKIGFGDMIKEEKYTQTERKEVMKYMFNDFDKEGNIIPKKVGSAVNGWNRVANQSKLPSGIVKNVRDDLVKEKYIKAEGNRSILLKEVSV